MPLDSAEHTLQPIYWNSPLPPLCISIGNHNLFYLFFFIWTFQNMLQKTITQVKRGPLGPIQLQIGRISFDFLPRWLLITIFPWQEVTQIGIILLIISNVLRLPLIINDSCCRLKRLFPLFFDSVGSYRRRVFVRGHLHFGEGFLYDVSKSNYCHLSMHLICSQKKPSYKYL